MAPIKPTTASADNPNQSLSFAQPLHSLRLLLTSRRYFIHVAVLLLAGEVLLNGLIIRFINYTEIDWRAYMQEVEGFLGGELDYEKLRGDTGPLVYPAGFLHFYAFLHRLTDGGTNILLAQGIFAGIYLLSLAIVFAIYYDSKTIPPYALVFLTLSKRLHSIYVLRLFNDGVAMLAMYACVWAMGRKMWSTAGVLFSVALSVKMNILMFLPAYGLILFQCVGVLHTISNLVLIVTIQAMLAGPFLATHPSSYLSRSFELSRVFFYKWTVNGRFLSESTFLSKELAIGLLVGHVTVLGFFVWKWCEKDGGPFKLLWKGLRAPERGVSVEKGTMSADRMFTMLFTSNLIGILFARSLHYQFYSWYAHQIVFLAWKTRYPLLLRVGIMVGIEYAWNVFPSTSVSSLTLLVGNALLLGGVYFGKP